MPGRAEAAERLLEDFPAQMVRATNTRAHRLLGTFAVPLFLSACTTPPKSPTSTQLREEARQRQLLECYTRPDGSLESRQAPNVFLRRQKEKRLRETPPPLFDQPFGADPQP